MLRDQGGAARIPPTEYVVTELEPGRSFAWVATGPGVRRRLPCTPSRLVSSAGTLPATATSQRLTKSEATEATAGFSPAAIRRSTPR